MSANAYLIAGQIIWGGLIVFLVVIYGTGPDEKDPPR
jgi:hypothetical protein